MDVADAHHPYARAVQVQRRRAAHRAEPLHDGPALRRREPEPFEARERRLGDPVAADQIGHREPVVDDGEARPHPLGGRRGLGAAQQRRPQRRGPRPTSANTASSADWGVPRSPAVTQIVSSGGPHSGQEATPDRVDVGRVGGVVDAALGPADGQPVGARFQRHLSCEVLDLGERAPRPSADPARRDAADEPVHYDGPVAGPSGSDQVTRRNGRYVRSDARDRM